MARARSAGKVTAKPLSAAERAFWLAFRRATIVIPRALDADLLVDQQLSLTEYSVLMHLSEVPNRELRMSELAMRCDLSLSGMTRIVSRLISDGLVERVKSDVDGRGALAVLTAAGFDRLETAYPDHLASVRRNVMDQLDGIDLVTLTEAFNRFGPSCDGKGCG